MWWVIIQVRIYASWLVGRHVVKTLKKLKFCLFKYTCAHGFKPMLWPLIYRLFTMRFMEQFRKLCDTYVASLWKNISPAFHKSKNAWLKFSSCDHLGTWKFSLTWLSVINDSPQRTQWLIVPNDNIFMTIACVCLVVYVFKGFDLNIEFCIYGRIFEHEIIIFILFIWSFHMVITEI